MAWFRDTALSLEKLKTITLDPEVIAEQLYEQKVGMLHKSLNGPNDNNNKKNFYTVHVLY